MAIGIWLIVSPWLLPHEQPSNGWHFNETVCGIAIILLSTLSFVPRLSKAHLAEIAIGLWFLGSTYFGSTYPVSPLIQSDLLTALFLLNFAIIPSEANRPPRSWRSFNAGVRQRR
jgi:hypothetical protein